MRGFAVSRYPAMLKAPSRTPHDTRALFARARRPPRSMAGVCTLVTRATLAAGSRVAGPVKAAALAARVRTSFMLETC